MNEGELASELRRLEEALLSADIRTDGEHVAQLLAEDFLEFGSSGRRYDRQAAIDGLLDEPHGPPTTRVIEDFAARRLADGLALVTYRHSPHRGRAGTAQPAQLAMAPGDRRLADVLPPGNHHPGATHGLTAVIASLPLAHSAANKKAARSGGFFVFQQAKSRHARRLGRRRTTTSMRAIS